jgi:hypothetical protein
MKPVVTRLRVGQLGFDSQEGQEIFLLATASRPALRATQPPIQWVLRVLSLGIKWTGYEADHTPPSSAKVKKEWSFSSTLPYVYMAWCVVKHKGLLL